MRLKGVRRDRLTVIKKPLAGLVSIAVSLFVHFLQSLFESSGLFEMSMLAVLVPFPAPLLKKKIINDRKDKCSYGP